jgi:hypothetical protein
MYCQLAETYSKKSAIPFVPLRGHVPSGWSKFDQVYSDISDVTDPDAAFKRADLVGQLPTIAHYSQKVQAEIIAVVLRDMVALPADCDRLVKPTARCYRWQFNLSA